MKKFPFKILLDTCEEVKPARKWCRKQFGELEVVHTHVKRMGWNKDKTKKDRPYLGYIGAIYDVDKNLWYNKVGDNPRAFFFKCPIDAIAFKLRWL